jgi:acetoin utilization deacetylase AcuC-like enzyme
VRIYYSDHYVLPLPPGDIVRAHCPAYLGRVVGGTLSAAEQRAIGVPWTPEMVERSRRTSGATVAAARAALDDGVAVNLAGGTHHAFRDRGGASAS